MSESTDSWNYGVGEALVSVNASRSASAVDLNAFAGTPNHRYNPVTRTWEPRGDAPDFPRRPTPPEVKISDAKAHAKDGTHLDQEEYYLTKGICKTCKRPVVRFVTTTGDITTIGTWAHSRGLPDHAVELEL